MRLIAIEGQDKVGKSTQIVALTCELRNGGASVFVEKMPRPTTSIGKLIRRMLRTGSARSWPNLFQGFQCLDKLLFQLFVLPSLKRKYDYVILDRWRASMWVYGVATGVNRIVMRLMTKLIVEPDLVFVFVGTPKARADSKDDSYDRDAALQRRVRTDYRVWSMMHPDTTVQIDADRSQYDISHDIVETVYSRFSESEKNE